MRVVRVQGPFRDRAEAAQGCAEVVRDVVERPAHAGEHRVNPVEHGVHQHAQLSEGVRVGLGGNTRIRAARPHDLPHRLGQRAHGAECRPGEHGAARQPDEDDGGEVEQQDTAEPREQLTPALRALSDLEQRAVAQAHGCDLEVRASFTRLQRRPALLSAERRRGKLRRVEPAPRLGHADEDDVLPGADCPDEQRPLRCRLCPLHLCVEAVHASPGIGADILDQRGLDDLAVVLPQ